jgi:hypothetical protein
MEKCFLETNLMKNVSKEYHLHLRSNYIKNQRPNKIVFVFFIINHFFRNICLEIKMRKVIQAFDFGKLDKFQGT